MIKQWHDYKIPAAAIGFVGPTEDPVMWQQTKGKVAYLVEWAGEGGTLPDQEITSLTKSYFNAYKKRWNVEPRGTGNVPGYSVLYIVKDAIERAGTLDVDALATAIEQTDLMSMSFKASKTFASVTFEPWGKSTTVLTFTPLPWSS